MKRVAILVVSLLVAASTLLAVSSPQAEAATCYTGVKRAGYHQVNICGSEPRPNHFTFKGRVLPRYGHRVVILQRKARAHARWRAFRKVRTTGRGKYWFTNITKLGYYRVKAKATPGFRVSYSTTLQIYSL